MTSSTFSPCALLKRGSERAVGWALADSHGQPFWGTFCEEKRQWRKGEQKCGLHAYSLILSAALHREARITLPRGATEYGQGEETKRWSDRDPGAQPWPGMFPKGTGELHVPGDRFRDKLERWCKERHSSSPMKYHVGLVTSERHWKHLE